MAGIVLPKNEQNPIQMGKDFLLSINTGTVLAPIWSVVGGQRSTSLSRSADEVDCSHKTSGGWKSTKAGLRSWGMDAEAMVILGDTGATALSMAFEAGQEINVQFKYPDGSYYIGWGSITDFSLDAPHDDAGTLSVKISGNGPLALTAV